MELFSFNVSNTEGHIIFDGHYYVLNEEFPIRTFFTTYTREKEPYKIEDNCLSYRVLDEQYYEVEIFNREKLEDTSKISEIDDEDGAPMRVCFFPTHKQKIEFRVIQKFTTFEDFLLRTTKYFTEHDGESLPNSS